MSLAVAVTPPTFARSALPRFLELPMKRFHVHVGVADLDANIRFYSGLFGAEPTRSQGGLREMDGRRAAA